MKILVTDKIELHRLTMPAPSSGFDDFITPWLLRAGDTCFVVDVGPSAVSDELVDQLRSLGVQKVDYVLLTHIHIDHAGGVAEFISAFPEAKIVVYPKAIPHLIDPAKLWESSLDVLGDLAVRYGRIAPVPRTSFASDPLQIDGLQVIDTPGHSSHHWSFLYAGDGVRLLFAGEGAGVYLGGTYIRPATPPRFFFDVAYQSVMKLVELKPSMICYGHLGYTEGTVWLQRAADQLVLWRDILSPYAGREETNRGLLHDAVERLLAGDPNLAAYRALPPAIAAREWYFLENSVKGFLGYLGTDFSRAR